jgi:hypothetical protein
MAIRKIAEVGKYEEMQNISSFKLLRIDKKGGEPPVV